MLDAKAIGNNIKSQTKEYGINVKELAEILNVSEQSIYHWYHGRSCPSLDNLVTMSHLFNKTIDELISEI